MNSEWEWEWERRTISINFCVICQVRDHCFSLIPSSDVLMDWTNCGAGFWKIWIQIFFGIKILPENNIWALSLCFISFPDFINRTPKNYKNSFSRYFCSFVLSKRISLDSLDWGNLIVMCRLPVSNQYCLASISWKLWAGLIEQGFNLPYIVLATSGFMNFISSAALSIICTVMTPDLFSYFLTNIRQN